MNFTARIFTKIGLAPQTFVKKSYTACAWVKWRSNRHEIYRFRSTAVLECRWVQNNGSNEIFFLYNRKLDEQLQCMGKFMTQSLPDTEHLQWLSRGGQLQNLWHDEVTKYFTVTSYKACDTIKSQNFSWWPITKLVTWQNHKFFRGDQLQSLWRDKVTKLFVVTSYKACDVTITKLFVVTSYKACDVTKSQNFSRS